MRTPVFCPSCKKRQNMDVEAPVKVWFRCRSCKRSFEFVVPLPERAAADTRKAAQEVQSVRLHQH